MEFATLREEELEAVLQLQEANLKDNLSAAETEHGFLSARFNAQQFLEMRADVTVVVAREAGEVAGYLCGSTLAYNRQFPILAAMADRFPDLSFRGDRLDLQDPLIYGPVCVGRPWRGQGVLRGLYGALRRAAAPRFRVGVCFVAADNPRSLRAHILGLGMEPLGDFGFAARTFRILGFPVEGDGGR